MANKSIGAIALFLLLAVNAMCALAQPSEGLVQPPEPQYEKSRYEQYWNEHYPDWKKDRDKVMDQFHQIKALYDQGKFAEAESLMPGYIRSLEAQLITKDCMRQAYSSQIALLRRLQQNGEADALEAKVKQREERSRLSADKAGIVGFTFEIKDSKPPMVTSVIDDTPAKFAGVQNGDLITSIDGKPIPKDISKVDLYDLIVGPPDTTLKLGVIRLDKPMEFTIKRMPESWLKGEFQQRYRHER